MEQITSNIMAQKNPPHIYYLTVLEVGNAKCISLGENQDAAGAELRAEVPGQNTLLRLLHP